VPEAMTPDAETRIRLLERYTELGSGYQVALRDLPALVRRMNDILVQGYYEIPLVNRGVVSAHLNTLKGVRINGWDSELWNIAEWRR